MRSLRPYQRECMDGLYSYFQKHEGNPLLVLPTGSGKSLIAAKISEDALKWPKTRILQVTHVRELVEQNHKQLFNLWPEAPAGVYCAGLSRKQSHHPITFASIQSVHNKAEEIGWRDLVLIDEAHLLGENDSSMYRKFLTHLKHINPELKVIGLSATPYRLKSGWLHKGENALFNDIAYELPIGRLVKEGYLSALVSPRADTQVDTAGIALQAGEFNQKEMEKKFDQAAIVRAAVDEMIKRGQDRKSWLVFCVSIEHAEHVQRELEGRGIVSAMVCDKTPRAERDQIKRDFAEGRIKAVCNVAVWTTGLDVPGIDLIILLRGTMSPGLLVQMLGRGMRPVYADGFDLDTVDGRLAAIAAGGKPNCLVLDMASNLEMHGPITHIKPPEKPTKRDRQGKRCKTCDAINPIDATECIECGAIFEGGGGGPREVKHGRRASTAAVMSDAPVIGDVPVWLNVKKISYEIHNKVDGTPSLRVSYNCSPNHVSEWIGFSHPNDKVRAIAASWWNARGGRHPVPETANHALSRLHEIAGVRCLRVKVKKNGKYTNVISHNLAMANTKIEIADGNLGNFATQTMEEEDASSQSEAV